MKTLPIFSLLMATTALAAPRIGYPYEPNSINDLQDTNNFFAPKIKSLHHYQHYHHHQQQLNAIDSSGYSGSRYLPPPATTPQPIITKQFFMVSAPEDEDSLPRTKHLVIGRPQRNYRVVFIKMPHSSNSNLKFTAEYAPQEEKTVIYVLNKKTNDLEVNEIATPAPTPLTKPEVFFIKYKTNEEALAAQKEIQQQYDHLGGSSYFSDEGTRPVKSVIGSLDGLTPDGGYDYKHAQNGVHSSINNYLPPKHFHS